MSEAWIIGAPSDLVAAVDRGLAQLGYGTRLVEPAAVAPDPAPAGDPVERPPALLVLVDEVERVGARVSGDEAFGRLPLLVIADAQRLATGAYSTVGHELAIHPFAQGELEARIARALFVAHGPGNADVVVSGSLELNTATYEVKIDGRPIDFTYVEYELLKFLVTHPNRVFSREALLSNVWGYDYYGGARTVDVHVRRVRAKLGQEHAGRIRTLRSVGYRWDGEA